MLNKSNCKLVIQNKESKKENEPKGIQTNNKIVSNVTDT